MMCVSTFLHNISHWLDLLDTGDSGELDVGTCWDVVIFRSHS